MGVLELSGRTDCTKKGTIIFIAFADELMYTITCCDIDSYEA